MSTGLHTAVSAMMCLLRAAAGINPIDRDNSIYSLMWAFKGGNKHLPPAAVFPRHTVRVQMCVTGTQSGVLDDVVVMMWICLW